jgi:hypothetical protein
MVDLVMVLFPNCHCIRSYYGSKLQCRTMFQNTATSKNELIIKINYLLIVVPM